MAWESFKASSVLPANITAAVSALNSVIDKYTKQAKGILKTVETANLLQAGIDTSATSVLISRLLTTIEEALQALIESGKIHVLYISIPKPIFVSSKISISTPIDTDTLLNDETRQLYKIASDQGNLGNLGFFKTFVESLADNGDIHRPQFDDSDYIGCQVLVAGESSLTKLLTTSAIMDRIFASKTTSLTNRILPIPQNLKAKVIGLPNKTNFGVRLDWDKPDTSISPKYYPITIFPKRIAVVRSTNPRIQEVTSCKDLFGTNTIKKGLISTDGKTEILDIILGSSSSFVDQTELDSTKTYYYSLAWELEIVETLKTSTVDFDKISNTIKVNSKVLNPPTISKDPDWVSFGSAVDLIPELSLILRLVKEQVDVLSKKNTGLTSALSAQKTLLENNLASYLSKFEALHNQIGTLSATLAILAGVYHTSFTGKGGNNYAISKLYDSLFNITDTTRPAFDSGEYVTGIVILYGAGRAVDIQAINDLFNLLFGASTSSALVSAIASLNSAVIDQTTAVLSPALSPVVSTATINALTGETTSEIDSLTGLTKTTETRTVIAEDGTAVEPKSDDNPNKGLTGKTIIEC